MGAQGRGLHHPAVMVHCAAPLGEVVSSQAVSGQSLLHQTHDLHLSVVLGRAELCNSGAVTTVALLSQV